MRVIAGSLKGRALHSPRGRATRPTQDRIREAIFSVLGAVDEARVLDLFAGSGALAIEALSRGAGSATLVDSSAQAIIAISRNLEELAIGAEVRHQTAGAFLARARREHRQYDLVFVDPPYGRGGGVRERLSPALRPVLARQARVVVESDIRAPLALDLTLAFERRYGDTLIRVYDG
ncbi:MAG: 16S rRNA (guanine(966)-N(2))-methyltransferase RsmD [Solirubrobacterales bacterium]|nr:16S rRNA (guanine(966)-N(2))-methyltransferase RsmD [Solirubrobacterales bacterium]MBV9168031.1 16S rRNA (guanine(966)-N(2))-methyltransferase RsmD [Solirubrobacterales bacterium]MBV9534626.1 16S rRNA (guanine(966)-N(2))-methyltransferase RsmD [Solirubrobacterales bacterium]